jgi:hypothetical protein
MDRELRRKTILLTRIKKQEVMIPGNSLEITWLFYFVLWLELAEVF